MLELSFARKTFGRGAKRLRELGLSPAEVLKDFGAIDTERRQAITQNETLQARRNRASEEIAKLKKSNQDASALIQETKELREQIQTSEKKAAESEARLRELLAAIPHLPHASARPLNETSSAKTLSECHTGTRLVRLIPPPGGRAPTFTALMGPPARAAPTRSPPTRRAFAASRDRTAKVRVAPFANTSFR